MKIKLGLKDLAYTTTILKCRIVCRQVLAQGYVTSARLDRIVSILKGDCSRYGVEPISFSLERKVGSIKVDYRISNYKNRVWVRYKVTSYTYVLFKFDYSYRRFERTHEVLQPFVGELHSSAK